MKSLIASILIGCSTGAFAQGADTLHVEKLQVDRKKKEMIGGRDSSLVLHIDTLIMKDRSQLIFYGKKDVTLVVRHAEIGDRAYLFGTDGKNNGTDFDITIRFERLGGLHILAGGHDANNNGSRTHPNGNGGNVVVSYDPGGVVPQREEKKQAAYLQIDTRAGGYRVDPQNDLRNIYSMINRGVPGRPLSNVSQGMVYSGSPGIDGKATVRVAGR